MLAASFPTLRSPAWTLQTDSGPAAEPASGVATFGFRVRLLGSDFTHPPARSAQTRPGHF
jgi:hypothetical protein